MNRRSKNPILKDFSNQLILQGSGELFALFLNYMILERVCYVHPVDFQKAKRASMAPSVADVAEDQSISGSN